MESWNQEDTLQCQFDTKCKKILKYTARTYCAQEQKRRDHEVIFSQMSEQEQAKLTSTDRYFTDEYIFDVLGESVGVANPDLAQALSALPITKREIVLLSYFFDLTDQEIGQRLNMKRRSVTYQRTRSLGELRKIMESEAGKHE